MLCTWYTNSWSQILSQVLLLGESSLKQHCYQLSRCSLRTKQYLSCGGGVERQPNIKTKNKWENHTVRKGDPSKGEWGVWGAGGGRIQCRQSPAYDFLTLWWYKRNTHSVETIVQILNFDPLLVQWYLSWFCTGAGSSSCQSAMGSGG